MKNELRRVLREKAKKYSPEDRRIASAKICEGVRAHRLWKNARKVLLFVPMANEPDISCLLYEGLENGKLVALPAWSAEKAQYHALQITSPKTDLSPGQFGIHEPGSHCPFVPLDTLDLILVPGVAFTRSGIRLGRGKGFYDRLLAQTKAQRCAVAFDWQIIGSIPSESHDVRMNYIATPSGVSIINPTASIE